jgi:anti-sigma regulatory factor (Ser/Thr protein kinase)
MTPSSGREPDDLLRRDYDGDLRTLQRVRRDVVEWLADHAAGEPTQEQAALIISELASNAIQASPGATYSVELSIVDLDHATISVRNGPIDRQPPPRERWRPAGNLTLRELSLRGRGLAIVDSLSDDVTIAQLDDEVTVTALLHIERVNR